ncbi:MAG: hypothetical protein ACFHVJ_12030 [Aestuariibacter sp.]
MQERILVVDTQQESRGTWRSLFSLIGRPNVQWQSDLIALFSKKQHFDVDLVFVAADLEPQISGYELIRYLRMERMVPLWCQFVVLCSSGKSKPAATFQSLVHVKLIHAPLSSKALRDLVNANLASLKLFKPVWQKIEKLGPRQLAGEMNKLNFNATAEPFKEHLDRLKVDLFMRNRATGLATSAMQQMKNQECKLEQKLNLALEKGEQGEFTEISKELLNQRLYVDTCHQGAILKAIYNGDNKKALVKFRENIQKDKKFSDILLGTVLIAFNEGISKALAFLEGEKSKQSPKTLTFYLLEKSYIHIFLLAFILGKEGNIPIKELGAAIKSYTEGKALTYEELQLKTHRPFLQLMLLVFKNGDSTEGYFELLYKYLPGLSPLQLSILLFAALKLGRQDAAFTIHKRLDEAISGMDVHGIKLAYLLTQQLLIQKLMSKEMVFEHLTKISAHYIEKNKPFWALDKYAFVFSHCVTDYPFQVNLLKLMKELSVVAYWDMTQQQVAAQIKKYKLTHVGV